MTGWTSFQRAVCRLLVFLALVLVPMPGAADTANPLQPLDASSPQATLRTLFSQIEAIETAYFAFLRQPDSAREAEVQRLIQKVLGLFDLSQVPPAARRRVGADAGAYLIDVLNRIEIPPLDTIPDGRAFPDPDKPAFWTIPGTEITLTRNATGERRGLFLFSAETVSRAGEFHALVKDLPPRRPVRILSWHALQFQSHGWMIPSSLVRGLPETLKLPLLENPLWKVLGMLLVLLVAAGLAWPVHRLTRRERMDRRPRAYAKRLLAPLVIAALVFGVRVGITEQIVVTGVLSEVIGIAVTIILYCAVAWAVWLLVALVIEWVIASPRIPDEGLDANLLRLLGRVIGILALATIMAYGAQEIGLPVLGVVAGLGVGGLAVALAAQSSIENLIGGLNLYLDRPIRVGDYCKYGAIEGYVEQIGLRSTRIRSLDRTITSVPNSEMAKVNITNLGSRDQMMFRHGLDLRYETTTEQLRLLTSAIREYLVAHPSIRTDLLMPRVHVIGFGDWSIKLDVLAYLNTRNRSEFLVLQEALILGIISLVEKAGAGFAFPSQTTYIARDVLPGQNQTPTDIMGEGRSAECPR